MRQAYHNVGISRTSTGLVLNLGHDWCAEHEGGVAGIRQLMGAKPVFSLRTWIDRLCQSEKSAKDYLDSCAKSLHDLRSARAVAHAYCIQYRQQVPMSAAAKAIRALGVQPLVDAYKATWAVQHGTKRLPALNLHATVWAVLRGSVWKQSDKELCAAFEPKFAFPGNGNTRSCMTSTLEEFAQGAAVLAAHSGVAMDVSRLHTHPMQQVVAAALLTNIRSLLKDLETQGVQSTALHLHLKKHRSWGLEAKLGLSPAPVTPFSWWDASEAQVLAFGDEAELLAQFADAYAMGNVIVGQRPTNNPFDRSGLAFATLDSFNPQDFKEFTDSLHSSTTLANEIESSGLIKRLVAGGCRWYALSPRYTEAGELLFYLNPHNQDAFNYGWFSAEDLSQWAEGYGPVVKEAKPAHAG